MIPTAQLNNHDVKLYSNLQLRQTNFNRDPCLNEFGVTVDTEFEKVDAYILKPPSIRYKQVSE